MDKWKAHKKNILFALACAGAILLLILLLILPRQRLMERQTHEMAALAEEIAREKTLLPIYNELVKEKEEYGPPALPSPKRSVLGRAEAGRITALLEQASAKSGMTLVSTVPDINSLTETGRFLSVAIALSGDFRGFHDFLTALGEIPFVWQVEKLRIAPGTGAREYQLTIWIGVEAGTAPEPAREPEKKPAGNRT